MSRRGLGASWGREIGGNIEAMAMEVEGMEEVAEVNEVADSCDLDPDLAKRFSFLSFVNLIASSACSGNGGIAWLFSATSTVISRSWRVR